MKKPTIGVLGVGEVGNAISQIFSKKFKVLKKDQKYDELKSTKIKALHVCLPYTEEFVNVVAAQQRKNRPTLVIIHSTVYPGTTAKIFKRSKIPIVHSPVMGLHPNLAKDILRFKKVIGPESKNSAKLAKAHFKKVGIKTILFRNSQESELAKLLDTAYYGWNIIFAKIVYNLCREKKIDFGNVYTLFNSIYNQGYRKSKPNVIRPILNYNKGPIGGHCIIPNIHLLEKYKSTNISLVVISENK